MTISTTNDVLSFAATLCAQDLYEEAARVLAEALRHNEHAHAVRYELSQVEAQLNRLTSAEQLAREAVSAGGDSYARGLGHILGRLGKLQEAETWLLRALRHNPGDAFAYAGLAAAYADQCRNSEALLCVERALSIQPDFQWARDIRKTALGQQTFLELVRATYATFAQNKGLNPDLDAIHGSEIEFPSAATTPTGAPRFLMSIPSALVVHDLGAAHLFYGEVGGHGYEFALRRLVDLLLQSDDVFIDVGAHWGVHSLSAATRFPKLVNVLAIEANPANSQRLAAWVRRNNLEQEIEVIGKAVGNRVGTAHLRLNGSSMGHSIGPDGIDVDMTTLDHILAERDWLRWRRLIFKIDVEGHEMEVFAGAQQLFTKCQVAAVLWEKSEFHETTEQSRRNSTILDFLTARGFKHYRFENESRGTALVPMNGSEGACNVVSLALGLNTL